MPHGASSLRYFFDHLVHPGWLEPLRRNGYFAQVPAPIQVGDGYRFPRWPAASYLQRMAQEQPCVVGDLITEVETNGNWAVMDDLTAIALELDATDAGKFAACLARCIRAADWFPSGRPELVGELAVHVASGGQPDVALDLMSAALAILPDDRTMNDPADGDFRLPPHPRTRLRESYDYAEALHAAAPGLARSTGVAWLATLADLLSESIALSSAPPRQPPEDHSVIWRPAVEDHAQNLRDHEARGHLTSTLRDAASLVASEDPAQIQRVVDFLWEGQWHIFKRIALHVVAECAATPPEAVATVTRERTLLDLYALRHEAGRMLNAAWPSLGEQDRFKVLDWIEQGPADEELVQEQREWWQLRWLLILRAVLDERRLALLDDLGSRYGTPEHPDFVSYSTTAGWVSESPLGAVDLLALPLDDIETLLEEWEPTGEALGPSYEGVARELRAVVNQRAPEFAGVAERWGELRHTYVRSILEGFADAVRAGTSLDWARMLALCSRVLEQTWERNPERVSFGDDPDWGWARQSAARLIEAGLIAKSPIPPELREHVWDLISRLAEDEEPSPASEERDREGGLDSFTRSINCTRGVAVHAAINYGRWLHRQGVVSTRAFEPMLELPNLLERRLDPAIDATACIRSVLAHHFRALVWLDKGWAYTHRTEIFCWSTEQPVLSLDVWHAYTGWGGLDEDVVDILTEDYFEALKLLINNDRPRETRDSMTHLAIMWLSDIPENVDAPSRVFELGSDALSAAFVDAVEEVVARRGEATLPDDAKKTAGLWAARLGEVASEPSEHWGELLAWASVFSWEGIPIDESGMLLIRTLDALIQCVPAAGGVSRYDTRRTIARLVACSREQPLIAMQALIRLVELDRDGWLFVLVRADMRECVEIAVRSGDGEAEREARAVANRLVGRGHVEFRDLADA